MIYFGQTAAIMSHNVVVCWNAATLWAFCSNIVLVWPTSTTSQIVSTNKLVFIVLGRHLASLGQSKNFYLHSTVSSVASIQIHFVSFKSTKIWDLNKRDLSNRIWRFKLNCSFNCEILFKLFHVVEDSSMFLSSIQGSIQHNLHARLIFVK